MKRLLPILTLLLCASPVFAQRSIPSLPAASGVTADDLFMMENAPAGTNQTQKATAAQIAAFVLGDDAAINALSGLTPAADKLPYFTNGTTAALADFSSFARTLLDDANASTARATLGLGSVDNTADAAKNVATSAALAANGTDCSAGQYARGVDASGNAENCTADSVGGDASTNTSSAVDGEVALFSGTGGKTVKRATGSGLGLLTSGVLSALAVTDDSVALGNGTTMQMKALSDCDDVGGNHVNYDTATNGFSCGSSNLSGITGLANPTASIGLSAVNGSATTAMRSDGAPALDISIAPTWTGIHTFSAAEVRLKFSETDQTTDEKAYDFDCQTKVCTFRTRTDADGAGANMVSWTRGTGTAITNVSVGSGASTYTFGGTGTATFSGSLLSSSSVVSSATNPTFEWRDTDQGTNLKNWRFDSNSGVTRLRTVTDAGGTGQDVYAATRGATTSIASVLYGNATDNPTHTFEGAVVTNDAFISAGTKFTASGCSNSATVGGARAGQFASGTTGACTVTITLPTSTNGWACHASDITTPANLISQSATTTTSCTITGTTVSGDTLVFSATGY